MSVSGFCGPKTLETAQGAAKGSGGRPKADAEQKISRSRVYLSGRDWGYVRLFAPSGAEVGTDKGDTLAIELLVEVMRRYRPAGPNSGGGDTHAAKLRPGTRTMLKKELAESREEVARLRAALAAAGVEV